MEEVFLAILGRDEAKAAIGDDLLDGTGGHVDPPTLPEQNSTRAVRSRRGDPHAAPPLQLGDSSSITVPGRKGQRRSGQSRRMVASQAWDPPAVPCSRSHGWSSFVANRATS